MVDEIEFRKWYSQNDLTYMIIARSIGTDILVRGDIHPLHEFVFQLHNAYYPNDKRLTNDKILEYFDTLKEVLTTGNTKTGNVICFGDDRIREVCRMDKANYEFEGPYDGSNKHIELRHNEQYGGEYPSNPILSSRAGIIDKVLQAFSSMRPKEQQVSWNLG